MTKGVLTAGALALVLALSGCSSKKSFEPENTQGYLEDRSCEDIKDIGKYGATFEDNSYASFYGEGELPEGYKFISDDVQPIFADKHGNVLVGGEKITLQDRVISASLIDGKLCFITQSNRYGIFDMERKRMLFQNISQSVNSINIRAQKPVKVDDLIIFATLDGKLMVTKDNEIIREITVTPEGQFNNIIYLDVINDTLIAATSSDILSIGAGMVNRLSKPVAKIVTGVDHIYILTKDGYVYKADEQLSIKIENYFKFANFVDAVLIQGNIYAIEKAGYMIQLNQELDARVYELDDAIEDFSFLNEGVFYYGGDCYAL